MNIPDPMRPPGIPADPLEPVREIFSQQPWYKEFSNTVTTGVGLLIEAAWLATTFGVDLPDEGEKWGFVIIGILTMLGVAKTPNGITKGQLEQMERAYSSNRHRLD